MKLLLSTIIFLTIVLSWSCNQKPHRDVSGEYSAVFCKELTDPPTTALRIRMRPNYDFVTELVSADGSSIKEQIAHRLEGTNLIFHGTPLIKFSEDFSTLEHHNSGCKFKK